MKKSNDEEKKLEHDIMLRGLKLINVLIMTAPFAFVWYAFLWKSTASPYYSMGNYLVIFIYLMLYTIFGRTYEAFLVSYKRVSEMVYSQLLSAGVSGFFLYIITWLLMKHLPNVLPFFLTLGIQAVLSTIWCISAHRWYFRKFEPKKHSSSGI